MELIVSYLVWNTSESCGILISVESDFLTVPSTSVKKYTDIFNLKATGWRSAVRVPAGSGTIGVLWFDSRRGLGIFLFITASRTALGPTQPSIQWVPGDLSLGVKRLVREADHSPPFSAEVKE
jgi:hypothetical protein